MALRLATERDRPDGPEDPDGALLAHLVLRKALADAYTARINLTKSASSSSVRPHDNIEARLFCEAIDGEWADARRLWCETAGMLEEDFLRRASKLREAGQRPALAPAVMAIAAE